MIKLPYGIMDFEKIIINGYVYIDRTHFIEKCENYADTLFCVRPRRMGKTLWLDTLSNYYDIHKKEQFGRLFGHLYIGKNPTANRNRYLILKFDFSKIKAGSLEEIKIDFEKYIYRTIKDFSEIYSELLPIEKLDLYEDSCTGSLDSLCKLVSRSKQKLYVLIDEYDNFINELISAGRNEDYSQLVTGDGLIKSFFKVLKAESGKAIDRIFVTGVTPIMLTDLSSAFNISTDITLNTSYNNLFGFTEVEIKGLLLKILEEIKVVDKLEEYLSIMKNYYDGFTFSNKAKEHIYNSTLSMYFLRIVAETGELPEELYDSNLMMDINKLEHITKLSSGRQKVLELLEQNEEVAISEIVTVFQLNHLLKMDESSASVLWSYLFYHGILTFGGMDSFLTKLKIPNLVSKKFYYERIRNSFFPDKLDISQIQKKFFTMLDVKSLIDFLENQALTKLSNRDYIQANELSMKILFLSLMMRDDLYLIDSEREFRRNYTDLLYIARADTKAKYDLKDILVEFKYVSLKDIGYTGEELKKLSKEQLDSIPAVKVKLDEAKNQLSTYKDKIQDHFKAHNDYARFVPDVNIHPFALVFIGFDRVTGLFSVDNG